MMSGKRKKTRPLKRINDTVVYGTALAVMLVTIVLATVIIREGTFELYDDMNQTMTYAVKANIDANTAREITEQVNAIYYSMDNPVQYYETDKEGYLSHFKSIEESEAYKSLRAKVNRTRAESDIPDVHLIMIKPEQNIRVFVLDCDEEESLPCGDIRFYDKDMSIYASDPGHAFEGIYTYSTVRGRTRTSGIPLVIEPEKGIYAYLLCDSVVSLIDQMLAETLITILIGAVGIALVVGRLQSLYMKKHVTIPLDEISDAAEGFIRNYDKRRESGEHVSSFSNLYDGDVTELIQLTDSLGDMEREIDQYILDLKNETDKRKRIEMEMEVAARIQWSMLPTVFPVFAGRDDFEIHAVMVPAKEVGGDLYDFFFLDDQHLAIVIGDVSGKGVSAALFMVLAKNTLKNRLIQYRTDVVKAVTEANKQLVNDNSGKMFVSAWAGVLEINTGILRFVDAGHEIAAVSGKHSAFHFLKDEHSFVLGMMEDAKYKLNEVKLEQGETVYLYTDGMIEARDGHNHMYQAKRLLTALNEDTSVSPKEIDDRVRERIKEFTGDAEQYDDMTSLCIRYYGAS